MSPLFLIGIVDRIKMKKLDFIEENRRFLLDNITKKVYNIYRVKEVIKMQVEKSDVEWLIGLISTWIIALLPYITNKKPLKRSKRRKQNR